MVWGIKCIKASGSYKGQERHEQKCFAYFCDGSGCILSDLLYKKWVVVTVTEHHVFHTNVHFQQLKTVSKGANL